uniref:uncharacterized protein LOC120334056 isoform X6 n=2 Tax=Styela clava TaxID=7725 RepID=UPI00193ABC5C|nr:uncharacterized protein LOC120334056 isoform X6 [Styela clava]
MFKEFDPKPRITGTMLKFIQKVRSKASDHKDDVEVYSKSQSDSEVDDSNRDSEFRTLLLGRYRSLGSSNIFSDSPTPPNSQANAENMKHFKNETRYLKVS